MTIELETRLLGLPIDRDKLRPGDQIPLGVALAESELSKIEPFPKKSLAVLDSLTATLVDQDTLEVALKQVTLLSEGETLGKIQLEGNAINKAKLGIHLEMSPPYCQIIGSESLLAHVWLHQLHLPNLVNQRLHWRKSK